MLISYAYIAMMGGEGLTRCNALRNFECELSEGQNSNRLPVLYTGANDASLTSSSCR